MSSLLTAAVAISSLLADPVAAFGSSLWLNSSSVQTSSGLIIGHVASNRSEVTEFLGIRYAEAPVGDLRFAPPKRYVADPGTVYNASNWVSHFSLSF